MSDFIVIDSAGFTVDELVRAARGEVLTLKPQLAVALLQAKLGPQARQPLIDLALDESADARGRSAATRRLAAFPDARQVLESLSGSREPLVADAAKQAHRELPPEGQ